MNLNLSFLFPEWIVVGFFVLLLLGEIFKGRSESGSKQMIYGISVIGAACAILATFLYRGHIGVSFGGMFLMDPFASFFKVFFAFSFFVIIFITRDYFYTATERVGEYVLILWCILIGLFFLASANHFLTMFVALEIVTLSFYVLASYKKQDISSIESGLKYLILGSLASAFMLFGIALIYVAAGTLSFPEVRDIYAINQSQPFLLLGIVLIVGGLGFKVASVPFQLWTPDVYQGAPTPTVAFLSVASKAAGFVLLARVLFTVFGSFETKRIILVSILAVSTLLYGNLGALAQTNIKRLFGYSSIGHAGYLLIGIAVGTKLSITALLYYLMAYLVTNLAVFYVLTIVGAQVKSDEIIAYTGLSKRSPFLAASLFLALLSLAGIPPLAGFFGKFMILLSAVHGELYWLALIGLLGVPISLYYYLSIVRVMYVQSSTHDNETICVSNSSKLMIGLLLAGILLLGFWQAPFVEFAQEAATSLF